MGLSPFHKCSSSPYATSNSGNPDPKVYNIKRTLIVGRFLIVEANYPGCSNFEGNKILVYENITMPILMREMDGELDPHFSSVPGIVSPIARFVPTQKGWDMAVRFAQHG